MYRKKCSHIDYVKGEVDMVIKLSEILKGSSIREFDSPIKALNEIFGGAPFTDSAIFGIVAAYKAGKTLMSIEHAFYFANKGYNVLYIDTEGSSKTMFKKWAPVFMEKYGLSEEEVDRIVIEDVRSLKHLMNYLGYRIQIYVKKSSGKKKGDIDEDVEPFVTNKKGDGKTEVNLERVDDRGRIWYDVKNYNIDFIILDSMSNPFRPVFGNRQQDNPTKSQIEAAIIQKLIELQEEFNVGVIVTLQASWNPADSYASITQTRARGGFSVYYNIKRMVFMNARDASGFRSYRKIWLVRSEDAEPWSKVGVVKITDMGYVDVPVSEWKDVFTPSELKLIDIDFEGE